MLGRFYAVLHLLHFVACWEEEARIPTSGCNGIVHFHGPNGKDYLVVANFWDGIATDMAAESTVFELTTSEDTHSSLVATKRQSIATWEAHGVDVFEYGDYTFLAIPNYYGEVTVLYKFDWLRRQFVEHQLIGAQGPSQTAHVIINARLYLIVAENFANRVNIYQFQQEKSLFELHQQISCSGVAAVAVETSPVSDATTFLAIASYHNRKGWETLSLIYVFYLTSAQFVFRQSVKTQGAHDAEMFRLTIHSGFFFRRIAPRQLPLSTRSSSNLTRHSGASNSYNQLQPTGPTPQSSLLVLQGICNLPLPILATDKRCDMHRLLLFGDGTPRSNNSVSMASSRALVPPTFITFTTSSAERHNNCSRSALKATLNTDVTKSRRFTRLTTRVLVMRDFRMARNVVTPKKEDRRRPRPFPSHARRCLPLRSDSSRETLAAAWPAVENTRGARLCSSPTPHQIPLQPRCAQLHAAREVAHRVIAGERKKGMERVG